MTYSVAKDYIEHNLHCNCISPARVHTPFVDGFVAKPRRIMKNPEITRREWLAGAVTAAGLAALPMNMSGQLVPPKDEPPQTGDPADRERRMKWWHEARFGMFIHWGLYSVLERHEWVLENEGIPVAEYEPLAKRFRPKPNAAREWAALAKAAGQKYMVMTTKHHEGFCNFATDTTDYCAPKQGPGRDLVKEYVEAALLVCHQRQNATLQEGAPGLRGRLAAAHHVFADAALSNVDTEFEQLVDAGARQPGFSRHIRRIKARTSREMSGRPGWPRRTFQTQNRRKPARAQATTVSGLDGQGRTPAAPDAGQPDPKQAVRRGQLEAFSRGAPKHTDLEAQSQVLQLKRRAGTEY
jgi:hypothetical protein